VRFVDAVEAWWAALGHLSAPCSYIAGRDLHDIGRKPCDGDIFGCHNPPWRRQFDDCPLLHLARVPLGESCAPVGVAMTTSEDAVFLVGGIALEDPSTVVPVSAFWNGRGWVSGGGHWSSLWSLSDVVVLMPKSNQLLCVQFVRLGCKSELLGRVCDKLGNDEHFSLIC